jgi:hypothetical protein
MILVDQRYPFGFYWERWNSGFYGFPPAQPADQAPAQYLFVELNHVAERLTELVGEARHVYWVTWFESDTDPRGSVAALLDAYSKRQGEQAFHGYLVRWWQLQPPTTLRLAQEFHPIQAHWEPGVTLLEGDWQGRSVPARPDYTALVTLRWQLDRPTSRPMKVSVRLRDAGGATLAQDDRPLLYDLHRRTTSWQSGQSALAVYSLPLPSKPGTYKLALVLYDEETLQPIGLSGGRGVEIDLGDVHIQ